ncbi:hypothetical protein M0805_005825 [Coniferiporia weirii]|nr:hypothetical protein M0805_005825 [Coniferiporia weirii]
MTLPHAGSAVQRGAGCGNRRGCPSIQVELRSHEHLDHTLLSIATLVLPLIPTNSLPWYVFPPSPRPRRTHPVLNTRHLPSRSLYALSPADHDAPSALDLPTLPLSTKASGVQAGEDCVKVFNSLKLSRTHKYIVYSVTPNNEEIVVSHAASSDHSKSNEDAFGEFVSHLPADEPRYGVFDFEFEKNDGSGKRNRIVFVNWAPDSSRIKQKMVYSSSKDALRRGLVGVQVDVQATDFDEVSYENVLEKCDRLR